MRRKARLFFGKVSSASTTEASVESQSSDEFPSVLSSASRPNAELPRLHRHRSLDPTADLVERNDQLFRRQGLQLNVHPSPGHVAMPILDEEEGDTKGNDAKPMKEIREEYIDRSSDDRLEIKSKSGGMADDDIESEKSGNFS